jgi:hypothetical protein
MDAAGAQAVLGEARAEGFARARLAPGHVGLGQPDLDRAVSTLPDRRERRGVHPSVHHQMRRERELHPGSLS